MNHRKVSIAIAVVAVLSFLVMGFIIPAFGVAHRTYSDIQLRSQFQDLVEIGAITVDEPQIAELTKDGLLPEYIRKPGDLALLLGKAHRDDPFGGYDSAVAICTVIQSIVLLVLALILWFARHPAESATG